MVGWAGFEPAASAPRTQNRGLSTGLVIGYFRRSAAVFMCRRVPPKVAQVWSVCGLSVVCGDGHRTREAAASMSRCARRSALVALARLTLLTP